MKRVIDLRNLSNMTDEQLHKFINKEKMNNTDMGFLTTLIQFYLHCDLNRKNSLFEYIKKLS